MSDQDEGNTGRRVTVPLEEYRADEPGYSQQALEREVEIVVDENTRIYVARRLAPLE